MPDDPCVPSYGPSDANILFVGEAPGEREVIEGRPFVGPAGEHLRRICLDVGIDPDACRFANLTGFRPPGNDLSAWLDSEGRPEDDRLISGLLRLRDEIVQLNPNLIVALGNIPLAMLTNKAKWRKGKDDHGRTRWGYTGISDQRGSILSSQAVGSHLYPSGRIQKVVATWHPSYLLRSAKDNVIASSDFRRIRDQSTFPDIRTRDKDVLISPPESDRDAVRRRLLGNGRSFITFDIETSMDHTHLYCVGFSNHRDMAVVVPIKTQRDIEYVRSILLSGNPLCAQNSIFDCSILEYWYNIPCIQFLAYDTMLASHAAYIELPKSLDFLTSIYTEQPFYKDMVDWQAIKRGEPEALQNLYQYNAIDAHVTHEIMEEQMKHDLSDPRTKATFDFEMALVKPLWDISMRGMPVDKGRMDRIKAECTEELTEMEMMLFLVAGKYLNVKSTQQIAWLLFDHLKIPKGPRTPSGTAYKVDDKTLASLLHECKTEQQKATIQLIRDMRERRDLISKFCDIELESDGRMRGHYNPGGTDTGRLAGKKFYPTDRGANPQNFPRDKRVRRVFIADKGKRYCYADLERAESLVVAHLTSDPEMLRVHGPGMNAHKETGAYLFDTPIDKLTPEQYYLAKQTRHSGNYMEGWKTFMLNVNAQAEKTGVWVDAKTSKFLIEKYRRWHVGLEDWWYSIRRLLHETRTLANLVGRRRTFYDRIDSILPRAIAYIPQSTVGDVLNIALLNLVGRPSDYVKSADPRATDIPAIADTLRAFGYEQLIQVHDAIGSQHFAEDEDKAMPLIQSLMQVPLTVPKTGETFTIRVEIATGASWGEVKEWKPKREEESNAA